MQSIGGAVRTRPPTARGNDRPIALVACPCDFHMYDWRTKTFYKRQPEGALEVANDVPKACREAFGR